MNQYPGYLTPDSLPVDDHCRTFKIPNDVQWLSVFMGALLPLIYPESWQQFGSLTPDESAEAMLNVIWDAYTDDIGVCPVVPTPYWDTVTDIDDQDPEGEAQPWYGQLVTTPALLAGDLTFVENAFIWTVAGFIALSGLPGAAIAFVPVAKRFVLAFKQHDLGGIVKVLIDFAEVAEIDTYGVGETIQNLNIFMPDDGETHTLYVTMADESNPLAGDSPFIQVVRKELAPGEVSPTNIRYNPGTDTVQTTFDDGSTWTDTPGQDPRHSPNFQFPPIGGMDPRCQAAANMVRWLSDFISETLTALAEGLDVLGIGTTLLPLFIELGPFAILFDLVIALASGLASAGATALEAAFTSTVYDQLLCIFDCDIEADGTVTAADLAKIQADIADQIGGTVQTVMTLIFALVGEVGVTNWGAKGDAPADCSSCDCGWCYQWLPAAGDGAWVFNGAPGVFVPDAWGTFDSSGWSSVSVAISPGDSGFCHYQLVNILKTFTAGNVTHFEFAINFHVGTQAACWSGQNEIEITGSLSGTNQFHVTSSGLSDGDNQLITWDGNVTIDKLEIRAECSAYRPAEGGTPGSVEIICIQAQGFGTSPFGDNNC